MTMPSLLLLLIFLKPEKHSLFIEQAKEDIGYEE